MSQATNQRVSCYRSRYDYSANLTNQLERAIHRNPHVITKSTPTTVQVPLVDQIGKVVVGEFDLPFSDLRLAGGLGEAFGESNEGGEVAMAFGELDRSSVFVQIHQLEDERRVVRRLGVFGEEKVDELDGVGEQLPSQAPIAAAFR